MWLEINSVQKVPERVKSMSRKKIIAGNWKMNKTPSEAVALVEELKPLVANEEVDVVFCVPVSYTHLTLPTILLV